MLVALRDLWRGMQKGGKAALASGRVRNIYIGRRARAVQPAPERYRGHARERSGQEIKDAEEG